MSRVFCRCWRFLCIAVLSGLALGLVGKAVSKEPADKEAVRIMSPPADAVLMSGNFDVIVKGPCGPLQIDGRSVAWKGFKPPIHVARVGLPPGWHELKIGDRQLDVVVALNQEEHDGPSNWPHVKSHTMSADANRCADCHESDETDGCVSVGDLKDQSACFECHDEDEFETIHLRPFDPAESCRKCHALHGSSRPSLLKPSVEIPAK